MDTVTVSSKYQIVIPKKVREALNIKPGQKVRVLLHPNRNRVDSGGSYPPNSGVLERH